MPEMGQFRPATAASGSELDLSDTYDDGYWDNTYPAFQISPLTLNDVLSNEYTIIDAHNEAILKIIYPFASLHTTGVRYRSYGGFTPV